MTGTGGEVSGGGERYYAEPRTHDRDSLDFYTEPAWTIDLLIEAVPFEGNVWDPACGFGTIPKAFATRGFDVAGTDIAERGYNTVRLDFLGAYEPPEVDNIVTNPPYGKAEEFVRRALSIAARKVYVLVQSKFPYSQRRYALFTEHPPAQLLFFSRRPSMPPGDKLIAGTVEAKGGKMDYLFVGWDRAHAGPTTCAWLGAPK